MKKLTETQKNFTISSCLNAGKTMEQALARVAEKEAKLNKPKEKTFDWSSFDGVIVG